MSITQEDFDGCFDAVKSYVDGSFEEIETWIREIQGRIKELESRPEFEDAGVWSDEKSYKNGNGVTYDGSFWIVKRDTQPGEKPGASSGFRLCVKRGKDGRDARAS